MKMHKNNLVKRGFAVLLALALVVGMMPMMALAANHTYGNGDCNVCKNGSGNSNNHVWGSDGKCECCGKTGGPTTPSVSPDPSTPPETETPEPTDQPGTCAQPHWDHHHTAYLHGSGRKDLYV